MPIPDAPIDFTQYDVAKAAYDQSEAEYKSASGIRDDAQATYDQAKAALDAANVDLETTNAEFQQSLSALVVECDAVGVPYPPEMQPPAPAIARRR